MNGMIRWFASNHVAANLLMGSASAKYAFFAPVFVPMMMLLDYPPELTQLAYRIGDSTTNMVSPMMSFFALIVAFVQRYDKSAGIGTVIATMLPYSICFWVVWVALFFLWVFGLGMPVGPATTCSSEGTPPTCCWAGRVTTCSRAAPG